MVHEDQLPKGGDRLMIMQWFVNETREKLTELGQKVEAAISGFAASSVKNAEEIEKLKGEIKAMKARMGKRD